jgi:hypothetical protein
MPFSFCPDIERFELSRADCSSLLLLRRRAGWGVLLWQCFAGVRFDIRYCKAFNLLLLEYFQIPFKPMESARVGGKVDENYRQKGQDDNYGHATSRMIRDT